MSRLDSRPPLDPDDREANWRATVTGIAVLIGVCLVGAGLLWALFTTPLPPSPSVPDHTGGDERAPSIDRSEP